MGYEVLTVENADDMIGADWEVLNTQTGRWELVGIMSVGKVVRLWYSWSLANSLIRRPKSRTRITEAPRSEASSLARFFSTPAARWPGKRYWPGEEDAW